MLYWRTLISIFCSLFLIPCFFHWSLDEAHSKHFGTLYIDFFFSFFFFYFPLMWSLFCFKHLRQHHNYDFFFAAKKKKNANPSFSTKKNLIRFSWFKCRGKVFNIQKKMLTTSWGGGNAPCFLNIKIKNLENKSKLNENPVANSCDFYSDFIFEISQTEKKQQGQKSCNFSQKQSICLVPPFVGNLRQKLLVNSQNDGIFWGWTPQPTAIARFWFWWYSYFC